METLVNDPGYAALLGTFGPNLIDRTGSRHAPWTLVEAEDKKFARLKVLRTIADCSRDHRTT